jgi:hypothetical protein
MKAAIRNLVRGSISTAVNAGLTIGELREAAYSALFWNTTDERFIDQSSFTETLQLIISIPDFDSRYGNGNVNRVLLRFLYEYVRRINALQFQEAAFEPLWTDFTVELEETHWLCRGVANLRNFRVDGPLQCLDLGDGISIRAGVPAELESLGFDDVTRNAVASDQASPFGSHSHILVVEERIPKEPGNLIFMEPGFFTRAVRALLTLRLSGTGSINIGPMWTIRVARFNVGTSGLSQTDFSRPTIGGTEYVWSEDVLHAYSTVYRQLLQLEKDAYRKAPGNLEIALRSFMNTFDGWPPRPDTQLLNLITSLEALFGIDTELSFRLAFRIAGLLAPGEKERAELFSAMKGFYDTRSRVVHGGDLKTKHQQCLARLEELRSHVRRLLRSFVAFGVSPPHGYSKGFFKERLDAVLLDATEREKLRRALGLI